MTVVAIPEGCAIDIERLARAYHKVNCPIRRDVAWHSCRYQAQHRATATKLANEYAMLARKVQP